MCEHHVHHSHHSPCAPAAQTSCCCSPTVQRPAALFRGHFPTREERIAQLQEYLQDLQAQAEAVKTHIAELESAS